MFAVRAPAPHLVDRYGAMILGLRKALKDGFATYQAGGFTSQLHSLAPSVANYSMGDLTPLLDELRKLRSEIRELKDSPPPQVIIKNPITLQQALKIEMPEYQKFDKKKRVG